MKTTMKAILVNLSNEQKVILNNLMLVFCMAPFATRLSDYSKGNLSET